jgi:hypothetical protein
MVKKPGLYANIHAKRKRIAEGSGEKMRKAGSKGAPTAKCLLHLFSYALRITALQSVGLRMSARMNA